MRLPCTLIIHVYFYLSIYILLEMETEVSIDEGVGEGNREERRPRLLRAEGSVLSEEFIEGLERQADATAQQLALHISSLHASLHAVPPPPLSSVP